MAEKLQGDLDALQSKDGSVDQDNHDDDFDTKVNRAITQRFNQLEKRLSKQFAESVSKFAPQQKEEQAPDETKELRKQIQLLLEKDKQREQELAVQKRNTILSDKLTQLGIPNDRVKHAVGFLTEVDKSVYTNEDGMVVMKVDQIEYDLDTAMAKWSRSADAKVYLPARNINGTGSTNVKNPVSPASSNSTNLTKEEMGNMLLAELDII